MKPGLSTGVMALTAGAAFIAGLDNLVVTLALPRSSGTSGWALQG